MKQLILSTSLLILSLFGYSQELMEKVLLAGTATNVSINLSAGTEMTLSQVSEQEYRLTGVFDNKNLFGSFNITGNLIPYSYGDDVTCIQFIGSLELGNGDNSGFPENTLLPFVVTISLLPSGVKGTFHVGKFLPDLNFDQYGTLDLYYK